MNSCLFLHIFTFTFRKTALPRASSPGEVPFTFTISSGAILDKHGIWMCDSVYVNPILSQSKSIPMNGDIIIIIT